MRCIAVLLLAAWCFLSYAALAAEPARPQSPLQPAFQQHTFLFADPVLTIELVAAEPEIDSPVAIAWDAAGAMYVAEMPGYPQTRGTGRIRRLTDADGDGRFERATTFAEDLDFPTSILPYANGIFITAAPEILYLKDTNDDGRAD